MPSWKKVVTSGSNAVLNQITASGDVRLSNGDLRLPNGNRIYYSLDSDANYLDFQSGRLIMGYTTNGFRFDMNGTSVKTIEMLANSDFKILGRNNKKIILEPQGTGVVEVLGTISGSSTSTGSFGRIQATTIGGNSPLTIEADNFSVDASGTVSGSGASTGSFGKLRVGRAVFGGSINVNGVVDTTFVKASNNIETTGGNISGSATSTGSFGQLDVARNAVVDNKLLVNTTNDARSHVIIADGTIGGPTFSGTFVDARSGHLKLGGNNSVTVLKDLLPGYDYTNVNAVDIGSTSARFNDIHFGGNISGSSTSTGSFGRGVIADTLRINKVNASATPLMIGAPSSNMAVFHISNHLGNESFRVDVSSDGDSLLTMRDSGQNADISIHTATNTYFNHNGNFGIGRTDPGYKLDVLHNGDEQFRVGRSASKYVAIRDDVMQFTGMTGNGMRIQTSDNSDIKFSAGTGDIIFDYANSGGRVISYADIRVHGNIIAENFIVSSSVTYMTQSFSSGSTIFGDDTDDTHQFTGSVFVKGKAGGVGESLVLGSYGDSATQLMIRSNGASNPNIRIERGSSGNNFSIQNNGALNILRTSTALMTFKYTGEVGIGNTNPTKELTVEGEIRIEFGFMIVKKRMLFHNIMLMLKS